MSIIKILPRTKLARNNIQIFEYLPGDFKNISKGSIVSVPFRKKTLDGVVVDVQKTNQAKRSFKLKTIQNIYEGIELPEKSFALMAWMAEYYISSLSSISRLFIPKIPKRAAVLQANRPFWDIIGANYSDLSIPQSLLFTLEEFLNAKKKNVLVVSGRDEFNIISYIKCAQAYIKENKQVLILVPTLYDLELVISRFPKEFKGTMAVFEKTKTSSSNIFYNNWLSVLNGGAKIIIGTRTACFAPFMNLGGIIIHREDAEEYKQYDQNPRYDARTLAYKLHELHNATIIVNSVSPRVETYYKFRKNIFFVSGKSNIKTAVVDMNKEMQNKNVSGLSNILTDKIYETMRNNKKAVVFFNRHGFSRKLICKECSYIFKCFKCLLPFRAALDKSQKYTLHCYSCGKTELFPSNCPECSSANLKPLGTGLQKVVSTLNKWFPKANVKKDDDDDLKNADIIVGANKIFHLPIENIGLSALFNIDMDLYLPDFRVYEKTFQTLLYAKSLLKVNEGWFIVQTYNPENIAIGAGVRAGYLEFYEQELQKRSVYEYPPYASIIKLTNQNISEFKAKQSVDELFASLSLFKSPDIKVFPPESIFGKVIRGRYRYQIIIKIANNSDIPDDLKRVLKNLPQEWLIDRDPISLL